MNRKWVAFLRTPGAKRKKTTPCYVPGSITPFRSSQEMIQMLMAGFVNPARGQMAKNSYQEIFQAPGEPFHEFNPRFFTAANEAGISPDSRVDDLFNKASIPLQNACFT
ncbi:hypothetical protein K3495_g11387 [Podosphaera aphanis]|nr:hypothetical protein K3495_g11387 [Podosphaera aphanis]